MQLIQESCFIVSEYPGAFYKHFSDLDRIPFLIGFSKFIQCFYYKPYYLHLIIIYLVLLEIILSKGKLFYGLYVVFYYTIVLCFFKLYHIINHQDLIKNMCMSDYLYLHFIKP